MRTVKHFTKKLSSVKVLSKEVGLRVKAAIKSRPRGFQAQLAKKLGLNEGTVSKWAAGRPPKLDHLRLAAPLMGKSFDFLLSGEERTPPVTSSGKDSRALPLCGAVAAGEPMAKIYEAKDVQWFDFSESFLRAMYKGRVDPERAVMLRVEGDSMEGELAHGSLVFVDRGPGGEGIESVNEDDIYMVRPPDEEGITLKRVAIEGRGDNRVLQLLPSGRVVGKYGVRLIHLKGRKVQSIVRGRVVGKFEVVGRVGKVM